MGKKTIKQWGASIPPISTKRTITSNLYWTHFTQNTTREIQALARDIISNIQISVFRKSYCFKNLKVMTKEPIQRDWQERNLENIHKPQKKNRKWTQLFQILSQWRHNARIVIFKVCWNRSKAPYVSVLQGPDLWRVWRYQSSNHNP